MNLKETNNFDSKFSYRRKVSIWLACSLLQLPRHLRLIIWIYVIYLRLFNSPSEIVVTFRFEKFEKNEEVIIPWNWLYNHAKRDRYILNRVRNVLPVKTGIPWERPRTRSYISVRLQRDLQKNYAKDVLVLLPFYCNFSIEYACSWLPR